MVRYHRFPPILRIPGVEKYPAGLLSHAVLVRVQVREPNSFQRTEIRKAGVLIGLENRDDLPGCEGSIPSVSAIFANFQPSIAQKQSARPITGIPWSVTRWKDQFHGCLAHEGERLLEGLEGPVQLRNSRQSFRPIEVIATYLIVSQKSPEHNRHGPPI